MVKMSRSRRARKGTCRKCGRRIYTNNNGLCPVCLGVASYCEEHNRIYPKEKECSICLGLANGSLISIDGQIVSSNDPRIRIRTDVFEFKELLRATAELYLER